MQIREHDRNLVEMRLKEGEARGHAETVEDVGELDARERESVALMHVLLRATCNEFLPPSVRDEARGRRTSRGIDFPAIRCMRSGTSRMISSARLFSLPCSYSVVALAYA